MVDGSEVERVIEVATRLFSELGYDGTSMRMIADAAGIESKDVLTRVGDKTRLYLTVMLRAHQAEQTALASAVASFTRTQEGVNGLVDAYLDFYLAHPLFLGLWLQRWMGDAADVSELEDLHRQPLVVMISTVVDDLTLPDVDTDHLVWTIVWSVFGFLSGGMLYTRPHGRHGHGHGRDPSQVADFRAYLHTLIRHMTADRPA